MDDFFKEQYIEPELSKMQKFRNKKKLSFLQKIFSITNHEKHKQICFLGIKVKLKLKKTNLYKKYSGLPVQKNKIVFTNFKGAGYGCNPKYIAEEIIKRNLPYELVWLVKRPEKEYEKESFPKAIKLVNYSSKEALRELSSAKVWIDNQRKLYHIKRGLQKKNKQFYIQTFHGSLGIKKVGICSNAKDKDWVSLGVQDADMIDYLISNSTFEDNVFKSCFFEKGEIKQFGHARNDIFFSSKETIKEILFKVYSELHIENFTNILLYVPSYRDDKRLYCYMLNIKRLKVVLEEKFGGKWVIITRMHPNLKKYASKLFDIKQNYVIDGSYYPDIQELLVAADVAVTDYSSCIFDFMLSRKPGFIFATDIEEFNTERGFYYPLESTPFPVAKNNEELFENIRNFDIEEYRKKVDGFLKEKGCMEDGHASEKIVDLIEELICK